MSQSANWSRRRTFWAYFVNCVLINNNKPTVVKLGACIVNVLSLCYVHYYIVKVIAKGKFHHEGPEGKERHNFTFSLTSALDVSGWSAPRHGRSTPRKENRYPLYRRLSGSQSLCGKSRPHHTLIHGPSSLERVAVPTELSRPKNWMWVFNYNKKPLISGHMFIWTFSFAFVSRTFKFVQAFQIHPVYCIAPFDTLHVFVLNTQMTVQEFWDITPCRSINLPIFRKIVIRKCLGSSRPSIVLDCLTLNSLRSGKL